MCVNVRIIRRKQVAYIFHFACFFLITYILCSIVSLSSSNFQIKHRFLEFNVIHVLSRVCGSLCLSLSLIYTMLTSPHGDALLTLHKHNWMPNY